MDEVIEGQVVNQEPVHPAQIPVTQEEKFEVLSKIMESLTKFPNQPVVLKRDGRTLGFILRMLIENQGA